MRTRPWAACLVATFVLSLCLVASFLGQRLSLNNPYDTDSTSPRTCHCFINPSRHCHCLLQDQKCSRCLHTAGESLWFDRHFEKDIDPLEGQDPLSSDALIWWLGLLDDRSAEAVQRKPQKKVPPKRPSGQAGLRCRTCAVVGNSRSLLGSGLGFRINQHAIVFRMNQAPVRGFEKDVGNRTTIRIMMPEMASMQDPGVQFLLQPLNSTGLQWAMNILLEHKFFHRPRNPGFRITQPTVETKGSKDQVLVLSLSFIKYIQEHWLKNLGQYPSLGFVTLMYALHTCDQVSVFGFGADRFNSWSHYWDDKYMYHGITQKFPSEDQMIFKLQCEGKVAVYGSDGYSGGPRRQKGSQKDPGEEERG